MNNKKLMGYNIITESNYPNVYCKHISPINNCVTKYETICNYNVNNKSKCITIKKNYFETCSQDNIKKCSF